MAKKGKNQGARERRPLSEERIVQTALRIVDEEGLEALSMRRLATALGVVPMAIYYHIPNKAALYDGIVDAVMSEIDLSVDDPSLPFRTRLRTAATAYRDVMLAHPKALPVVTARPPHTPAGLRAIEVMLDILRDGGLEPADAMAAVDVVAAFVQGTAVMLARPTAGSEYAEGAGDPPGLASIPPDQLPRLMEVMASGFTSDPEAEFDFGLEALVRGLTAPDEDSQAGGS